MTNLTPVQQHITSRFFNLYGAPTCPDYEGYLAEYERAFSGTSEEVLKAAASMAIDNHVFPTWPTVGEVKKAIEVAATRQSLQREHRHWGDKSAAHQSEPTPEARARVDELMRQVKANLQAHSWAKTVKQRRAEYEAHERNREVTRAMADTAAQTSNHVEDLA